MLPALFPRPLGLRINSFTGCDALHLLANRRKEVQTRSLELDDKKQTKKRIIQ